AGLMEHFSLSDWPSLLGHALLAAVGGLLGHVMREHDRGHRLQKWRAAIEALSFGFVSLLVMLLCRAMDIDPLWSDFVAGLFGWLGANASIRMLERIAYEKFGL